MSIQGSTDVQLAPNTLMTITPFTEVDDMLDQAADFKRRRFDRRKLTRRNNLVAVDFERRSNQPRRVAIRRTMDRASA